MQQYISKVLYLLSVIIGILYNCCINSQTMFYLLRNLRTTLTFPPTDIDKVGDSKQIWNKLQQKIQGKCTNQYGIIVQIPKPYNNGDDQIKILPLARLDTNGGCSLQIQFSAISFKAQKNDLIWAIITQISPDCITCALGPIDIRIPKSKLDPQLEYDKYLNCFKILNKNYKIQFGNYILCKCFQNRLTMNSFIQIIAQLPKALLDLNIYMKS